MSEESGEKKEVLRTIVLLLVGFVVGFATHAYISVTGAPEQELPAGGDLSVVDDTPTVATTDGVGSEGGEIVATSDVEDSEPDHTFTAVPNNVSNAGYSVSVIDQDAGSVVFISQFDLPSSSWIAVREDNDGKLGNILGAGWYAEGKNSGVVELLRKTAEDSVYYVVVYVDNGDKQFDHMVDKLVKDSQNNVLVTKFRTY